MEFYAPPSLSSWGSVHETEKTVRKPHIGNYFVSGIIPVGGLYQPAEKNGF
jgi:hypothetical protein